MIWRNCLSLQIWRDLSKQCTLFLMKWGLKRSVVHVSFTIRNYFNDITYCRQIRCDMSRLSIFSFWNAGKNAQSSASTTSAQPNSQSEGIYTVSHIPFWVICRDCMSTQVYYHVLSQYTITTWKANQYAQPWIPYPSAELATHSAVKQNVSKDHGDLL